jgi:hypothetical protein
MDADVWQLVGDVVNLGEDVARLERAVAVAADEAENGPLDLRAGAEASRAEQAAELTWLRDRYDAAVSAAEAVPVAQRDQVEAAYREKLTQRGIGGVRAYAGVAGGDGGVGDPGDIVVIDVEE